MKLRDTPRVIPESDLYLKIKDSSDREWQFKVPSVLKGLKLIKSSNDLYASFLAIQKSDNMGSLLFILKEAGPEVMSLFGAVIGISWFNEKYDLVSKQSKDFMEYGESVFEELHDFGLGLEDIILIAGAIIKIWVEKNTVQQEAMERLGFFNQKKEQKD